MRGDVHDCSRLALFSDSLGGITVPISRLNKVVIVFFWRLAAANTATVDLPMLTESGYCLRIVISRLYCLTAPRSWLFKVRTLGWESVLQRGSPFQRRW